jgi:hypothetical protein
MAPITCSVVGRGTREKQCDEKKRRAEGRVVMWQELRTGDRTAGYRNKKCG